MRPLAFIAALAIGFAGGSVALAQHGDHHGSGGAGSGSDGMTMVCCDGASDMCDPAVCPGHKENKDGKCDMSKCCGSMMKGMEDMMDHHGNGMDHMSDMEDMMRHHHDGATGDKMCGERMKCCKKKNCCAKMTDNPSARSEKSRRRLPTLW